VTPAAGLDLRVLGMVLSCNGDLIATGAGAAALGNPVQAVAWLVETLHHALVNTSGPASS